MSNIRMLSVIVGAIIVVMACLFPSPANALSWPLCEAGGAVWVTERPTTDPKFPGANLWWFCDDGSLNILGNGIDACVPMNTTEQAKSNTSTTFKGNVQATKMDTVCNDGVADALCVLLGFQRSFQDDTSIETASPNEPVVALTGQFCLRKGLYSDKLPTQDELAALEGEPCDKITRLACIRDIDTLEASLAIGLQEARLNALEPSPAAGNLTETGRQAKEMAHETDEDTAGPVALGSPAGRRLARRNRLS